MLWLVRLQERELLTVLILLPIILHLYLEEAALLLLLLVRLVI
jgi:hypothetical protein